MKLQSTFQAHFCVHGFFTDVPELMVHHCRIFCSLMYFLNKLSTILFNIFIIFIYYL